MTFDNWAGNVRYTAGELVEPRSVDELRTLVAARRALHAVGTRHSFSRVADTGDATGTLVSLAAMPPSIDVDSEARTAWVAAGLRYAQLAPVLDARGLALAAMASLPHISVAGACATGTHGSGSQTTSLAAAVCGLELITAGGDLVTLTRDSDPDVFDGAVVALGGLGVVVRVQVELVPAFTIRQRVWTGLPIAALADHVLDVLDSAYSVSAFTTWDDARTADVWVLRRDEDAFSLPEQAWFTATPAGRRLHPIPGQPSDACTEQLDIPGPWHERLPHFRADQPPSSAGAEVQSEYLVDRRDAGAAVAALNAVAPQIRPVLQVCEIRSIAADPLWLSAAHERPSVALHFTWLPYGPPVAAAVAVVEVALRPFAVRPHWGKVHGVAPDELRGRYPRLADFARLRQHYDPHAVFINATLRDLVD